MESRCASNPVDGLYNSLFIHIKPRSTSIQIFVVARVFDDFTPSVLFKHSDRLQQVISRGEDILFHGGDIAVESRRGSVRKDPPAQEYGSNLELKFIGEFAPRGAREIGVEPVEWHAPTTRISPQQNKLCEDVLLPRRRNLPGVEVCIFWTFRQAVRAVSAAIAGEGSMDVEWIFRANGLIIDTPRVDAGIVATPRRHELFRRVG